MAESIPSYNPKMADEPIIEAADKAETTQGISPQAQQAIDVAAKFIRENSTALTLIMGASGVDITIGEGWTTNLKTGKVTVDPTFFIGEEYNPDWVNYGMMHEISAHLVPMIVEPQSAKERLDWSGHDQSRHLFLNILEDIAGNKRMHSLLPRQGEVAAEVYSEKLIPEGDYITIPKHLQFLYKIIRQEMIPGSQTIVEPEVDAAIQSLRESELGDIISQATERFKTGTLEETPRQVQFKLWLEYIYPKFEELLEQDRNDERFKPKEGDESGEGQGKGYDFGSYYEDYEQNRHPEPISHEEAEEILHEALGKQRQDAKDAKENTPQKQAEKRANQRIQAEIGNHTLRESSSYRRELSSLASSIDEMRQFFSTLLDERVVSVRRLNKAGEEGAVLNPNTIAQTVADIRAGKSNPPAFLDYGRTETERKAEGHFDYFLVVDNSGSMEGDRIIQARRATIVFLEGLASFEREIRAREQQGGVQLAWDVRTSVYTFGEDATEVKPLGHTLTEVHRLDAVGGLDASESTTRDYLALQQIAQSIRGEIAKDPSSRTRRRIITVVTDGASSNQGALASAIRELTALGASVVAIGIQTDVVRDSYLIARSIDDVTSLTKTLSDLIESEITR